MDLIESLSSQLGLDPLKAQGLAGAVFGKIEEQVTQKLGDGDSAALRSQLPELDAWKSKISALGDEGGLLGGGGLLGAAGSLLGGAGGLLGGGSGGLDLASLLQLAGKAGLSGGAAEKLVPIVVTFLQSRLDPNLLAKVLSVVPGLKKLGGGGGLAGMLGGIL